MAIPPKIGSTPYIPEENPNELHVKESTKGFDITPLSKNVRIAIRIKDVASETRLAATQKFQKLNGNGHSGKMGTITNDSPDHILLHAIDEKTKKCFSNLKSVTFFVPDNQGIDASILSVEKIE